MKSAFSKLLALFGKTSGKTSERREAAKAVPSTTSKTDRDRLFQTMWMIHGISGKRLEALKADLEPLFRMAESTNVQPSFAEGTKPECRVASSQPVGFGTLTLKFEDLIIETDGGGGAASEQMRTQQEIEDAYYPLLEPVIGDVAVALGEVLGLTLFNALYASIPWRTKTDANGNPIDENGRPLKPLPSGHFDRKYAEVEYAIPWQLTHILAFYRVATAVAGLEAEGEALGRQIQLLTKHATQQVDCWHEDYADISYESAAAS